MGALVVLYGSENLIHHGGFGVMALGSPVPLLILPVCLKVALGVVLHLREHQPSEAA